MVVAVVNAAILTSSDYRVLVGDLDDEQMMALSRLGIDYRPVSAYERGNRYAQRLENDFNGNISALAEAENISRKIITRCINTAHFAKISGCPCLAHPVNFSPALGGSVQAFREKKLIVATDTTAS